MFKDRQDAAEKLAEALKNYKNLDNTIVLGIPRGGVVIGALVSDRLSLPFDIIIVRKLPLPYDPEAGFGAIAEDGSVYLVDEATYMLPEADIRRIESEQVEEVSRRKKVLRKDRDLTDIRDKTVIIVDDGFAMGSTMRAAIRCCRLNRAAKIIAAVPVSGEDVAREIRSFVDELVVLEKPVNFRAVAQVYEYWKDVSDEEVLAILEEGRHFSKK